MSGGLVCGSVIGFLRFTSLNAWQHLPAALYGGNPEWGGVGGADRPSIIANYKVKAGRSQNREKEER